jgi:hypothetical protein
LGWTIALGTIAEQIWMLFQFVKAAEIDLSNDKSDLRYTWKCARDQVDCNNKLELDPEVWLLFGILMVAHLSKDIINGLKLIVFSSKETNSSHDQIRFFVGGTLLSSISMFTLFVLIIYNHVSQLSFFRLLLQRYSLTTILSIHNKAIATSNTEIIINLVVILFITDLDELFFEILMVVNSHWVRRMSIQTTDPQEELANKNSTLKAELGTSKEAIVRLTNEGVDLRERLSKIEAILEEGGICFASF